MEVEKLSAKYDLDVTFSPYFLDPSTPPEGKPRRQMSKPDDPPSHLELRAEELGIRFTRGRTWTSNSHISLQAAEFVSERHPELMEAFHKRMFRAYFDELADIGTIDSVVKLGTEAGLPEADLRSALEGETYRERVDEGIDWARQVGVSAVPTFILDEKYAVVGAQPVEVFEQVLEKLGKRPRES